MVMANEEHIVSLQRMKIWGDSWSSLFYESCS
ncbi:hypothetical protein AAZX31_08G294000 [Glycine max]